MDTEPLPAFAEKLEIRASKITDTCTDTRSLLFYFGCARARRFA